MNNDTPLRKARKAKKLTLLQVASAIGIDNGSLSRIEKGNGCSPATAAKLAAYFEGALTELEILYPERYVAPPLEVAGAPG